MGSNEELQLQVEGLSKKLNRLEKDLANHKKTSQKSFKYVFLLVYSGYVLCDIDTKDLIKCVKSSKPLDYQKKMMKYLTI